MRSLQHRRRSLVASPTAPVVDAEIVESGAPRAEAPARRRPRGEAGRDGVAARRLAAEHVHAGRGGVALRAPGQRRPRARGPRRRLRPRSPGGPLVRRPRRARCPLGRPHRTGRRRRSARRRRAPRGARRRTLRGGGEDAPRARLRCPNGREVCAADAMPRGGRPGATPSRNARGFGCPRHDLGEASGGPTPSPGLQREPRMMFRADRR